MRSGANPLLHVTFSFWIQFDCHLVCKAFWIVLECSCRRVKIASVRPEAELEVTAQDMGNGVTVEELMRTVEDLSRSCH